MNLATLLLCRPYGGLTWTNLTQPKRAFYDLTFTKPNLIQLKLENTK
jgi:hypothetical protein